jgi:hypothetical protein
MATRDYIYLPSVLAARAELARMPRIEAWVEGLELRGTLRASDPV